MHTLYLISNQLYHSLPHQVSLFFLEGSSQTLSQHKSHSNLDQLSRANCYPNFKQQPDLGASKNEITRSYEDLSYMNTDEEKESGSEFEAEEAPNVVNNNGSIF